MRPFYPQSERRRWSEALFRRPRAEYRGIPFWSWNDRLDLAQLERQIECLRAMGFGGFQMHARTGLRTRYLGEEFMGAMRHCTRRAQQARLQAWVYDEDRWPSGYAGGLVTTNPQHRVKYVLFTRTPYCGVKRPTPNLSYARAGRTENGRLLARYEVRRENGSLRRYRRLRPAERAAAGAEEWLAYLETTEGTSWFNGQTYLDTLSEPAVAAFIATAYERFAACLRRDFGRTVPAIFTDEPQHVFKEAFECSAATHDLVIPATTDLFDSYRAAFDEDLLDRLPELFWEPTAGSLSRTRYRYHEHLAARFAQAYARQLGTWCTRQGVRLTGHMMEEPTLLSQTKAVGEVMRSLAHFHIPGVDMLCDRTELNTVKQAQSVARQYDRPAVMSELYGATGWHFDFIGHKGHGDWQAALGVTVRVPHLALMSMRGEAKRDYPASIHYQSPWWREYRVIEDHFSRVNVVLTRGRPVVRIAVIHPIESYWLAYGPLDRTRGRRERLETQFAELPEWLLGALLDFDYVSEALLPQQVRRGARGTLRVGAMTYDAVIVPGLLTVRSTTLDVLEPFASQGGRLIFAGEVPSLVDAAPSPRAARLASRAMLCDWAASELLPLLEPVREIGCTTATGAPVAGLLSQLRQDGAARHLFLCNRDREASRPNVHLALRGRWRPVLRDTFSGRARRLPATYTATHTELAVSLEAHGHALLTLSPGTSRVRPAAARRWIAAGEWPDPVAITRSEPNALLLDQAEWRWNDGPWQPREELLRIGNVIRERCSLPPENGHGVQPWADATPEAPLGRLELRFAIASDHPVRGALLAVEELSRWDGTLNGRRLRLRDKAWWVDESIRTCALPPLRPGDNTLVLGREVTRRTSLEWVYALGDFGVRVEGRRARLTAAPRTLSFGDWVHQGLPFYTGNVAYHFRVRTEGGRIAVTLPRYKGAAVTVAVDGGPPRHATFAPHRWESNPLAAGWHEFTITVLGHRHNAFGPVHNCDPRLVRFGPTAWRSQGVQWAYEYQLHPMGLLVAPRLERA